MLYSEETFYVPLTQGKTAIVCAAGLWVMEFKWCAAWNGWHFYANRSNGVADGKPRNKLLMHRVLLNAEPGVFVDHINGNTLDNRLCNLRLASCSENSRNQNRRSTNTSGFKGVTYHKGSRRWKAIIGHQSNRIYLGCFNTAIEAANAYDQAARKLHGAFARLNFPIPNEVTKWLT